MKPSERIAALQREIIAARIKRPRTPTEEFMLKISGMTEQDITNGLLADVNVKIAAILAYLDEKAEAIQ